MNKYILIIVILLLPALAAALEECKGTATTEEIPCLILLPYTDNCSTVTVSYYRNGSTYLRTSFMSQYSPFLCNETFNFTLPTGIDILTYTFNYSTGDTGSIIVERDVTMNFFNLLVYIVFLATTIVLIILMHSFKQDAGASIVYGWVATAIASIMGAMILSPAFTVIRDISFIIDVDYYLAALFFILAFYTGAVSYQLRKEAKPQEQKAYY